MLSPACFAVASALRTNRQRNQNERQADVEEDSTALAHCSEESKHWLREAENEGEEVGRTGKKKKKTEGKRRKGRTGKRRRRGQEKKGRVEDVEEDKHHWLIVRKGEDSG